MKKMIGLLILFLLVVIVWSCQKEAFLDEEDQNIQEINWRAKANPGAVKQFPYFESFESEFQDNPDGIFLPHWWSNFAGSIHLGQFNGFGKTGTRSLFLLPEEEEVAVNARLFLDLSEQTGTYPYVRFWVATRKNGSAADLKKTRLSVAIILDGVQQYGVKIGPMQGFENKDSCFLEYFYPIPPVAYGQSEVIIQFSAKTGGGPHLPAILLIDDVEVLTPDNDEFPPSIVGEVRPVDLRTIDIRFTEPLLPESATNEHNYHFYWPEEEHGEAIQTGKLPKVTRAQLSSDGYNVQLELSPGLNQGDYYGMQISNIFDLHGNMGDYALEELVYNTLEVGDLIISEIFFADPSSAQAIKKLQFVEIYNPTNKVIPLGGLRVKGAISAHGMPNVKLAPGDFWVITRNGEAFRNTFGFEAWEWKGSWIQEEPEDGEVQMLYIQDTEHHSPDYVDFIPMNLAGDWSHLAQKGYSIELCGPIHNNAQPASWRLADSKYVPFQYLNNGVFSLYATPGTGPMVYTSCGDDDDGLLLNHKSGKRWATLCVDRDDLAAHLAHGDWLVACEN